MGFPKMGSYQALYLSSLHGAGLRGLTKSNAGPVLRNGEKIMGGNSRDVMRTMILLLVLFPPPQSA